AAGGPDEAAVRATVAAVAERIETVADAAETAPPDDAPTGLAPARSPDADGAAPAPRRDLGLVREVAGSFSAEDRSTVVRRADFIAAARRAVQSAIEASGLDEPGETVPAAADAAGSPFARIGQAIRSRRRPLLLAAAALVLAIGALQIFVRPTANAEVDHSAPAAIMVERPVAAAADGVPIPSSDVAAAPRITGPGRLDEAAPAPTVGSDEIRAAALR